MDFSLTSTSYYLPVRVYNVVSTVDLFQLHEYIYGLLCVIYTIDVKSSAGIYKGSALNLWWLYSGVFTPDIYYNIVQSTGAGTRRDVVIEEIQQQQQQQSNYTLAEREIKMVWLTCIAQTVGLYCTVLNGQLKVVLIGRTHVANLYLGTFTNTVLAIGWITIPRLTYPPFSIVSE